MLGTDLISELKKDYEIYGADIAKSSVHHDTVFYECDITDKESISKILADAKPDVCIHSAAYTDVDGCELNKTKAYKINSEAAQNVALACKESGLALVYISTDFVFDGKKESPYKEDDKPAPLSVYGDSKLKGEDLIKKELERYFILRTSWLYGKYGKNFVDTILAKAKTEKVLKVVSDQAGSPTYTKDLAEAIHKLLGKVNGYGIYHVSNSGSVSWYEYAKEIVRLAGLETKVVPISSEELARPAKRPAMSILDNSKFIKFTDFKMRDWKSALKDYLS